MMNRHDCSISSTEPNSENTFTSSLSGLQHTKQKEYIHCKQLNTKHVDGHDQTKLQRKKRSVSLSDLRLNDFNKRLSSTARIAALSRPDLDKNFHLRTHQSEVAPKAGDFNKEAITTTKGKTTDNPLADLIDAEDWASVERCCKDKPSLARRQVNIHVQGERITCLPLYSACCNSPTLSAVHAIMSSFPPSASQCDKRRGRLPLHNALLHGASISVVQHLIQAYPDSLRVQDNDGNLPLHIASFYGNDASICTLLKAYPEGCKVANKKGKLPLHILCARTESLIPSAQTIQNVKEAFPRATTYIDHHGRLPIHAACNVMNPRPEVLGLLLRDNPQTLTVRDERGVTPFMLAHWMNSCGQDGKEGMKVLQLYISILKKDSKTKKYLSSVASSTNFLFKGKHGAKGGYESKRVLENSWLRSNYAVGWSPVTRVN